MNYRTLSVGAVALGLSSLAMGATSSAAPLPAIQPQIGDQLAAEPVAHRFFRGGHGGVGVGIGAGIIGGLILGQALGDGYYYGDNYDYGYGYGTGYYDGGGSVAYCERRFRSYDPASGTYMGFDGLRHSCP